MSCHHHFPSSSLAVREGGRGWWSASSEGGRQPITTADSSRSAQERGVGVKCMSVFVCVYMWGALLKPLCVHPPFAKCSRLLFPSQRAFGWVCPRGVVTPHSFPIIPGVSLETAPSPDLIWPFLPPLLCFHPCRYFLDISWGKRWRFVSGPWLWRQQAGDWGGLRGLRGFCYYKACVFTLN